jgi:heterodisulfide reductase subunit C
MTNELFTRDGEKFTDLVVVDDKGKPGYIFVDKCHRCGGAGGFKGWPGFTCFRCAGRCTEAPKFVKLYTAEQLVKVNAAQAKRDAAKLAKHEAKQAAAAAVVAANTVKFNTNFADILTQLGDLVETKEIVKDIVRKGRELGNISGPQYSVLTNAIESAAKLAAAQSSSSYVGAKGDKVRVQVTVSHVGSYDRTRFHSFDGATETVWIVTMVDADGNNFVTKTPTFKEAKGETFILSGTVKEHSEYRGVKQTIITRPKRTEIARGTAVGFKKIGE